MRTRGERKQKIKTTLHRHSAAPLIPPRDTKTKMSGSKLVGQKRRNLQTKKILKKLRKVQKIAADMRAETSFLRKEMDNMDAAAEEKKKAVKLEEEKRDGCLTENLLMSVTEHLLMGILFPPSGNY